MDAVCLLVAGVVRSALPTREFTLAWEHSVERTRWEERYRIAGNELVLTEARVQGSGAGMEPGVGASLEHGWWRWEPERKPLPVLRLTFSTYTRDYRLCWDRRCQELASLLGRRPEEGEVVEARACARVQR